MNVLNKHDILDADDRQAERLEVPEWGGVVFVRVLSGKERDAFEASVASTNGRQNLVNLRARFAALVLADDNGNRLFTDAEFVQLGAKSAVALQRVFEAAQEVNAMTEAAIAELEEKPEPATPLDCGTD